MPNDIGGSGRGMVDEQTQLEKSCGFGICTFVKTWYDKVDVKAAHNKVEAEICPRCHGMFSSSTLLLPKIVLHAQDKKGEIIRQIYLSGEDYTIYRTRQGVNIHFADCRWRERQQRKAYSKISEKLCRLRFLTSQMAHWWFSGWFGRTGNFYDHQIAEAINLIVLNDDDRASEILCDGVRLAEDRLTNENRIRYLVACLAACLAIALISGWALWLLPSTHDWAPYLLGGAAGAAGAVFSIATRVRDFNLNPCSRSVMNYVMGWLRVLIGFVAGAIILFTINGAAFGKGIAALFSTEKLTPLTDQNWICIALIGFLGGFAEQLVPNLLQAFQSRVRDG